jgi:hypothetical protein
VKGISPGRFTASVAVLSGGFAAAFYHYLGFASFLFTCSLFLATSKQEFNQRVGLKEITACIAIIAACLVGGKIISPKAQEAISHVESQAWFVFPCWAVLVAVLCWRWWRDRIYPSRG